MIAAGTATTGTVIAAAGMIALDTGTPTGDKTAIRYIAAVWKGGLKKARLFFAARRCLDIP
jgi:hypothetical protein